MENNPKYELPPVETYEAEEVIEEPQTGLQTRGSTELGLVDITALNTSQGLKNLGIGQQLAYAALLIKSGLVPKHFNTPEKALLAFEQGALLGLRPIEALTRLYVIDNKVCMYAELMRARARRAGLAFQMTEDKVDVLAPDENGYLVVVDWRWTVEMYETLPSGREMVYTITRTYTWAKNEAKLMGNPVWGKFMSNMFFNRLSTFLIRMYCPDVLLGNYLFDELADGKNIAYVIDEGGNPVPT